MPAIKTSSDLYQNRSQALTTYKRSLNSPSLSEAMQDKSREKMKAAQVQEKGMSANPISQTPASTHPSAPLAASEAASRLTGADRATVQKAMQPLYAPPSATRREHDDRHSMITGGTIDFRA